jgi:hypothetical protein
MGRSLVRVRATSPCATAYRGRVVLVLVIVAALFLVALFYWPRRGR